MLFDMRIGVARCFVILADDKIFFMLALSDCTMTDVPSYKPVFVLITGAALILCMPK